MNKIIKNKKILSQQEDLNLRRFNNLSENDLSHTGVLGMKWGIRKDRSSGSSSSSSSSDSSGSSGSSDSSGSSKGSKISGYDRKELVAKRKTMTDKELNDAVNRLQTEKRLKELAQEDVSSGKKYAVSLLKKIGKTTVETTATTIGQTIGQETGKKIAEAILKKVLSSAASGGG